MNAVVEGEVTIRYWRDQSTLTVTGTVVAVSESNIIVETGIEDSNMVTIQSSDIVEVTTLKRRVDILEALADWIDTDVIAEAIADHVKNELGEKLTLRGCKEAWLRELESLLR